MSARESGKKPEGFVHVRHTRSEEQRLQYEQIASEGVCPFCPEHLPRFHKAEFFWEGEHWRATSNDHPYEGTKYHLLIILRRHARHLRELTEEERQEYWKILVWIEDHFSIESGSIGFRFGKIPWNGASVDHLHAHVVVADPDAPAPPRFKMGRTPDKK